MIKNLSKILLLMSLIIAISGCTPRSDLYTSVSVIKNNDTKRNRFIIDDLLNLLQRYYAPAQTTFVITPENSKGNLEFAEQFEDRFRNTGFAISREKVPGGILLAWKIDTLGWLIRATYYIDNATVTGVYKRVGSSWVRVGPFSVEDMGTAEFNILPSQDVIKESHHKKRAATYAQSIVDILRIREKPTTNSKIIGYLKKGQKVRVAYKLKNNNTDELWIKLKHSRGYVSSKYLKITGGWR